MENNVFNNNNKNQSNNIENNKSNFILDKDKIILKVNKKIYNKKVITQTTYVLLDKYYFLIDEDDRYYIVEIKKKDTINQEFISAKDANIFLDELIESSSYLDQLERTSQIRELILEKAIISQTVDEDLLDLEKEEE